MDHCCWISVLLSTPAHTHIINMNIFSITTHLKVANPPSPGTENQSCRTDKLTLNSSLLFNITTDRIQGQMCGSGFGVDRDQTSCGSTKIFVLIRTFKAPFSSPIWWSKVSCSKEKLNNSEQNITWMHKNKIFCEPRPQAVVYIQDIRYFKLVTLCKT